jgi:hypothetical protein
MRRFLSFIIIITFVSSLLATSFVFKEYSAVPESNQVTITWQTKSETGVKQFIVLRSNDDKTFIELTKMNAKGPGISYEYIDKNVMFKGSSALFYKIKAVREDGQLVEETESIMVVPNLSGVYRTWGAIKALFR